MFAVQLDKALNRPTSDRNDAILSAMKEVSDANQYLIKLEHLPTAVLALARNRQSLARANSHCSNTYDRMMKTHSVLPNVSAVESILVTPLESACLPSTAFSASDCLDVDAQNQKDWWCKHSLMPRRLNTHFLLAINIFLHAAL